MSGENVLKADTSMQGHSGALDAWCWFREMLCLTTLSTTLIQRINVSHPAVPETWRLEHTVRQVTLRLWQLMVALLNHTFVTHLYCLIQLSVNYITSFRSDCLELFLREALRALPSLIDQGKKMFWRTVWPTIHLPPYPFLACFILQHSRVFVWIYPIVYQTQKGPLSSTAASNDVLCHKSLHNGSGGGAFIRLTEG